MSETGHLMQMASSSASATFWRAFAVSFAPAQKPPSFLPGALRRRALLLADRGLDLPGVAPMRSVQVLEPEDLRRDGGLVAEEKGCPLHY
jgi:hypothetical protein